MPEFKCEVVKVGPLLKHPNADTLSMTNVWSYPVLIKNGEIAEGDLAVYIPIDAVCPTDNPKFSFLGNHPRIKAKKLRGVFSMGMLMKADPDMKEGDDAAPVWGIKKYEEQDVAVSHNGNLKTGGDCESVPFFYENYDVDHGRKYGKVTFKEGEEVVITEKIHGCNSRFVYYEGRLYAGSHNTWKKPDEANMWWKVAKQYDLERKLARFPKLIFYGETFGWVQDLRYDHKQGEVSFNVFDIFDLETGKWLDWQNVVNFCNMLDLPMVPVLYQGPWADWLPNSYMNGNSMRGNNMREGIVVAPVVERFDMYCGRPKLKYVSEAYLLRQNGTERH
jgi:RNA ligase (TIGR02306 family)